MQDQFKPVLLNLLAAFLGAYGQYLYKLGAKKMSETGQVVNWEILVGMVLFTAVMLLFIIAFKLGGKISVTYPVYSLTFLIGVAIGIFLEKEAWHPMQLVGSLIIVLGIFMVIFFNPVSSQ